MAFQREQAVARVLWVVCTVLSTSSCVKPSTVLMIFENASLVKTRVCYGGEGSALRVKRRVRMVNVQTELACVIVMNGQENGATYFGVNPSALMAVVAPMYKLETPLLPLAFAPKNGPGASVRLASVNVGSANAHRMGKSVYASLGGTVIYVSNVCLTLLVTMGNA